MLRIRGHHLLCTVLFQGQGYDARFSACMEQAVRALTSEGEVLLCCGEPDDICHACPNYGPGGECRLGTKDVERRDRVALQVLSVQPGPVRYTSLRDRLRGLPEDAFSAVCRGCRWEAAGLCTYERFQKSRLINCGADPR